MKYLEIINITHFKVNIPSAPCSTHPYNYSSWQVSEEWLISQSKLLATKMRCDAINKKINENTVI
jgi:hypothetical protein